MKQAVSSRCSLATISATSSGRVAPSSSSFHQSCIWTGVSWPSSGGWMVTTKRHSGASIAAGRTFLARALVETMAPTAPLWVRMWW